MKIACLGWGSLVWNPDTLPVAEPWRSDGPSIPIEFARQSDNGRITLVVTDAAPPCQVLWAQLGVQTLDEAQRALSAREGPGINLKRVAFWSKSNQSARPESVTVGQWAAEHELDGVVWTSLSPRFNGTSGDVPSADEVVAYLGTLDGFRKADAEEYIRRAPLQIRTPYRDAIEQALGWTPEPPTAIAFT